MSALIDHPLLALIPALLFMFIGSVWRDRVCRAAGAAWILYFLYEMGMKARLLCSGECNIRVDLLLIYPALAVLTMAALVTGLRAVGRRRAI